LAPEHIRDYALVCVFDFFTRAAVCKLMRDLCSPRRTCLEANTEPRVVVHHHQIPVLCTYTSLLPVCVCVLAETKKSRTSHVSCRVYVCVCVCVPFFVARVCLCDSWTLRQRLYEAGICDYRFPLTGFVLY